MTYKDYLDDLYYKDSKCKQYESFDDWISDQDIDDIILWAEDWYNEISPKKLSKM